MHGLSGFWLLKCHIVFKYMPCLTSFPLHSCSAQIYCTMATSKRLKDSGDGGMDLQAYIEFKRNFRSVAVLCLHAAKT